MSTHNKQMSKFMIEDSDTIDHVNPFVQHDFSLPGSVRNPGEFARHDREKDIDVLDEYVSPACEQATTAGWRGADMCQAIKPNCPISRPLYPGRNIDKGYDENPISVERKGVILNDSSGEFTMVARIFILLIILLLFLAV